MNFRRPKADCRRPIVPLLDCACWRRCCSRRLPGAQPAARPNIVLIYMDDLGYGDTSAYGATTIRTPQMDRIAREGVRFTSGYATSATCTPSRFSHAHRQVRLAPARHGRAAGQRVADHRSGPHDAARRCCGRPATTRASSASGISGSGPRAAPTGTRRSRPGPNEIGFAYSFIMAATGDRVPTVYVEDGRVVGLDPNDPIRVDYQKPIGDWPTGKANPELLTTQRPSHGHDQTIVNGVSRIGYMTGGKAALWRDQDMADVVHAQGRLLHRAAPARAVLPLLRHARSSRPARAARALRRHVGHGPARRRHPAIRLVDRAGARHARSPEALGEHARDLHERQRPGGRRRVCRSGGGEARRAQASGDRCAAASTAASRRERACPSSSGGRRA